ncbi:MAG TPA: glycosyltransferase family 4 protein [Candidatus Saccharimonadales bacterium]|nr:glycosyltransferase family 4 protein [Candidatus Saccharimonadales bacterium]
MNILWLAWKDYIAPGSGGAEVVLRELIKRQVAEGHNVTLLTSGMPGAAAYESRDGIEIIRVGNNRYAHPFQALLYYLRHLRGKYDVIIETVNTAPYFSLFFRGQAKAYALYHQLARDVWFHETKPPVSHAGYYLMEPLATWLLSRSKAPLITVSESTKRDLSKFGWQPDNMYLISEGIEFEPVHSLADVQKYDHPTMLSFGALRVMKRTLDQVIAFEIAKHYLPELRLIIAGDSSGPYGKKVLDYIQKSPYKADITCLGRVSYDKKIELMQRCHVITVTSVKEGWGLIVTEAASQGTPAVVYDVDGLRDSVRHERTGLVTAADSEALAWGVVQTLSHPKLYESLRKKAWQWSRELSFDASYRDFKVAMETA